MVMDESNPAMNSVQTVVPLFYRYAFTYGNKGYGGAIVILLLIVILALTIILQKTEKMWVYHS